MLAFLQADLTPLINLLPQEVMVYGVSGGTVVTVLISLIRHFGVHKVIPLPPQGWNFLLSMLVAAGAAMLAGEEVATALLSAFAAMVTASGLHETVGHAAAKVVGNK